MQEEMKTAEPTLNGKTKKLNVDDLDSINTLRKQFNELYNTVGLLTIDKNILEVQLDNINKEIDSKLEQFADLRQQEENLLEKLKNYYGDGQINVNDGTFTSVA